MEAGTDQKAFNKTFYMTCSTCFTLYTIWNYLSRVRTFHIGLDHVTSIINQENAVQTCLQANLMEALSHLRFPGSDGSNLHQVDIKQSISIVIIGLFFN